MHTLWCALMLASCCNRVISVCYLSSRNHYSWGTPVKPVKPANQLSFFGRARRLSREHERVTIEDLLAIADEEDRKSMLFATLNFRICWSLRHDRTSRDYAQAASYFEFKEL